MKQLQSPVGVVFVEFLHKLKFVVTCVSLFIADERLVIMGQKKYALEKEKYKLDKQAVKDGKDEEKEDLPDYSFFSLYRFSTGLDKFLLSMGLLSAIGTGIIQPPKHDTIRQPDGRHNRIRHRDSELQQHR
ncbi:hypothetical protein NQ318_013159 [Aromia moschata]|uniref:Uncharacterized protein n=1 Tax=Aromia moschata TaxID=1265417 RepID=A0AAV8Y1E6_9CUCU|nr:hypothetical protein NQ318_013159 [Aromia moschata]